MTAVFSVCVRGGMGGVFTGLGGLAFHSLDTGLMRQDEGGSADESTLGDLGNIFLTVSSAVAAGGMPLIGNAPLEDTTA